MSTDNHKAKFWGLTRSDLHALFLVTRWYNGLPLHIRGEERRIATHPEVPLEDMFRGASLDYNPETHQRLLDKGFFKEQYICRRKIDWVPTEQGIRAIRDVLEGEDKVRPRWADPDDSGPIFGDPNEGLLHRKGVEIAGYELPSRAWAHHPNGRPYGVTWYPEDRRGKPTHDLHITTADHLDDLGVEVITANNNTDYLVDKWERYAKGDRITFWIFDNRDTACRLFNELDYRGLFFLDGQFRETGNWSAKAINRKLWRSRDTYDSNNSKDIVHTVTGLLEGDRDTIQNLLENYYSNK